VRYFFRWNSEHFMFIKVNNRISVEIYKEMSSNFLFGNGSTFVKANILKVRSIFGVVNFKIPQGVFVIRYSNFLIFSCLKKKKLNPFLLIVKSRLLGLHRGYTSKLFMVGVAHKARFNPLARVLYLRLGFRYTLTFKIPLNICVRCPGRRKKSVYICGHDLKHVKEIALLLKKKDNPNVYTGKGIFFKKEKIIRKIGKVKKF
jgi:ribosomal protein L6P/L9E